jgi:hypothetical protein
LLGKVHGRARREDDAAFFEARNSRRDLRELVAPRSQGIAEPMGPGSNARERDSRAHA